MTFAVLHTSKEVGHISLDERNTLSFERYVDEKFRQFVQESVAKGIIALRDINHRNIRIKVSEKVSTSHPLFGLALRQWLEHQGYEVVDLHPETDTELSELLNKSSAEVRNKIEPLLPTASYLEKTYLIEQLRKGIEKNIHNNPNFPTS
ncbi:MAG: hypothetical protein Q7R86_01460 [bacterium]|nr:hypothetical protein [bacterium]